jgi:uncharacterized protein
MGRIAPRKRKAAPVYQTLQRTWLNLSQRLKPEPAPEEHEMTGVSYLPPPLQGGKRQVLKTLLLKIWHLPDDFHWMEPLPYSHRRWVIIFGTILLLSLLWPYSGDKVPRSLTLSSKENSIPLLLSHGQQYRSKPSEGGNWQRYKVQAGQTLAQLFRDHDLPVNEVFAMAQIEGSKKPLSNLKAGQEVRIQQNNNGVISALSITTRDGNEVLFRRQTDGSYRRVR